MKNNSEYHIKNRPLGITDDDVMQETDLRKLMSWRHALYMQLASMTVNGDPTKRGPKAFTYFRITKQLYKLVRTRIGEVRADNATVADAFMAAARKYLTDQEYDDLLTIATGNNECVEDMAGEFHDMRDEVPPSLGDIC